MSASPTPGSYAFWNPPSAPFPIRYWLTLFREIDFFVGDGYRRIPHGGLEVGAVLYGHEEPWGSRSKRTFQSSRNTALGQASRSPHSTWSSWASR